jgi:hypothetical protein
MKENSLIHETDVNLESVVIKTNNRKRNILANKGLSLRPVKSLSRSKAIKPKTLLPAGFMRKEEDLAQD